MERAVRGRERQWQWDCSRDATVAVAGLAFAAWVQAVRCRVATGGVGALLAALLLVLTEALLGDLAWIEEKGLGN